MDPIADRCENRRNGCRRRAIGAEHGRNPGGAAGSNCRRNGAGRKFRSAYWEGISNEMRPKLCAKTVEKVANCVDFLIENLLRNRLRQRR